MAGLGFLLVFWVLAGACQRHGVGVFLLCNSSSSLPRPRAPANGWPGFPFGFLGAGSRLPKARRGRVYCAIHHHQHCLALAPPSPTCQKNDRRYTRTANANAIGDLAVANTDKANAVNNLIANAVKANAVNGGCVKPWRSLRQKTPLRQRPMECSPRVRHQF